MCEGDRRLLGRLLIGCLASGIAAAGADSAIDACAAFAAKDDRIACLEQALREASGSEKSTPVAPGVPDEAAVPSLPPLPPADEQAFAGERMPGRREGALEVAPATGGEIAERGASSRSEELGAEQVARRAVSGTRPEDEPVTAAVVAFDFVGYRRLVVELDNGQVWRQTNGDRADVSRDLRNEQRFDIELRKTGLGGYRMYLTPLNRTVRVERLK